ncbi:MAG: ATP-dependent protease ATPase subunit HslU [Rickettsiaceae bacterium H1]|nr:ATP-dependent protease ATPase subunit HslU [Rickettsiaceae bacterium H1]
MSEKEGKLLDDDDFNEDEILDEEEGESDDNVIKDYSYNIESFTPTEVVKALDRFIVGQDDAKRAVAIALRNRWRRSKVPQPLRDEIIPKNILMIGPTGVGKTEIARRLAKLSNAPFIKVEATKFTEIGYVGRDVDSIIRDLVEVAVDMVRRDMRSSVEKQAKKIARDRILDALVGADSQHKATRNNFAKKLDAGKLDNAEVSVNVRESASSSSMPMFDIPGMHGGQVGVMNVGDVIGKLFSGNKKTRKKKVKVKEAWNLLINDEMDKMLDEDQIIRDALDIVINNGIIFLDEIDKIAENTATDSARGEVSRKGVQRDLLPLLEGTTVATKYGNVKTDHILFIASGAFHFAKPSDLLPELQGRLPIRVELSPLSKEAMISILQDTESSLLKQYSALLATEKVKLKFTGDGVKEIAEIAINLNNEVENIGARRLHTIMEKLLEEISFNASEKSGSSFTINEKYVKNVLNNILKKLDLSKFIL